MVARQFFFVSCFLVTIASFLVACNTDDLKNAAEISAKKITFTTDTTKGVELVYSDSAKVKAKGSAPILVKVTPSSGTPYTEMPKGVKIDFYDSFQQLSSTVTADYAIRKETEQLTTLKKHVVVKDKKGNVFTSEELVWDEKAKIFYSNQLVNINFPDGSFFSGNQFKAPQDFSSYELTTGTGQVDVKEGFSQ